MDIFDRISHFSLYHEYISSRTAITHTTYPLQYIAHNIMILFYIEYFGNILYHLLYTLVIGETMMNLWQN